MNSCGQHESFVCVRCGYPDPAKYISALRQRIDELEAALQLILDEIGYPAYPETSKIISRTAMNALRKGHD